jgi:hypothetical protein
MYTRKKPTFVGKRAKTLNKNAFPLPDSLNQR